MIASSSPAITPQDDRTILFPTICSVLTSNTHAPHWREWPTSGVGPFPQNQLMIWNLRPHKAGSPDDSKGPSYNKQLSFLWGFPDSASGQEPACQCRTFKKPTDSIPESRSFPGGGHGNPLQYFCLENPMDREAWWATVHRITKSQTRLKWLSMRPQLSVVFYSFCLWLSSPLLRHCRAYFSHCVLCAQLLSHFRLFAAL